MLEHREGGRVGGKRVGIHRRVSKAENGISGDGGEEEFRDRLSLVRSPWLVNMHC